MSKRKLKALRRCFQSGCKHPATRSNSGGCLFCTGKRNDTAPPYHSARFLRHPCDFSSDGLSCRASAGYAGSFCFSGHGRSLRRPDRRACRKGRMVFRKPPRPEAREHCDYPNTGCTRRMPASASNRQRRIMTPSAPPKTGGGHDRKFLTTQKENREIKLTLPAAELVYAARWRWRCAGVAARI